MSTPDGVEGLLCGGDGEVDILSGTLGDLGQELASRWVDDTMEKKKEFDEIGVGSTGVKRTR